MLRRLLIAVAAFVTFVLLGCSSGGGGGHLFAPPTPPADLALEQMPGSFSLPVMVTSPPGDPRLFVVEKTGLIRIIKNGAVLDTPFLDLSGEVLNEFEPGLVGLVFDPHYAANGRCFVTVCDVSHTEKLVMYHVSADPDVASPTGQVLLSMAHPNDIHWGGMLAFGPDGMLYMSVGDGGSSNDSDGNGQSTTELFGDLLRLDVRTGALVIPPDNPYPSPARRELWCIGLRNPWRFSFDRATGDLYIGDVGEATTEEIDVARASAGAGRHLNFGWNIMEGDHCFDTSSACNTAGLTPPAVVYDHGAGCAVIGGFVYRGAAIPGLAGTYFYSDYCSHGIHSFYAGAGGVTQQRDWPGLDPGEHMLSFGQDAAGELYLCTEPGRVLKIVAATAAAARTGPNHGSDARAARPGASG